jgi:hypothetical protein
MLNRITKEKRLQELREEPEDPQSEVRFFEREDGLLSEALDLCREWNGKDPIKVETEQFEIDEDGDPVFLDESGRARREAEYAAAELQKLGWSVQIEYDVFTEPYERVNTLSIS